MERERYAKLNEIEKALHEDKKCHEQAVMEFQEMTEKLRKNLHIAAELASQSHLAHRPPIGDVRSGPLVAPSGNSLSVFDSAMHKTSNLISNYMLSPTKLGQGGLGTGVQVL